MGFFDRFDRFTETSGTGSTAARLNQRWRAIIDWNAHLFPDARVLDIASHDGRWSLAALEAGATHALAVEARPHLVANAEATFRHYGVPADRYELRSGEAFDELRRSRPQVDVVLLLGFFYHVAHHTELVRLIAETGARHVIVDTNIVPEAELHPNWPAVIALRMEPVAREDCRADAEVEGAATTPIGIPSRAAVADLFDHFGFDAEEYDWGPAVARNIPDLWDYNAGQRTTYRMTRRGGRAGSAS